MVNDDKTELPKKMATCGLNSKTLQHDKVKVIINKKFGV